LIHDISSSQLRNPFGAFDVAVAEVREIVDGAPSTGKSAQPINVRSTTSNLYPRSASTGNSPDLLINNRGISSKFLRRSLAINWDYRSAAAIAVTRQVDRCA